METSGLERRRRSRPICARPSKAAAGHRVRREGPGAGRSDDSIFFERRIPAIIFFTGFHADYHRPGDDWDKIDAPGTARVATLALELAARIAARADRPEFVDRTGLADAESASRRASLGSWSTELGASSESATSTPASAGAASGRS